MSRWVKREHFAANNRGELAYDGEFVLAALDECELVDWLIFGNLSAINGNSVAREKLAAFALAGSESGFDENIEKLGAFIGSGEALGEQIELVGVEIGKLAVAKENSGDFLGRFGSVGAMDNFGDLGSELALTVASTWVFGMFGENFVELFWGDESEVLEVIFESVVGLVEPELVEIEDAGFVGIEPDSVAFGLAELAAGDFIDNKWAAVSVGFGVLEAFDEMNARGAVAVLIGAAELKIDVVFAEEMKEIIALDKGVAKLGIRDAGAAFADASLDELAIEKLSHAEGLANLTKEWKDFDLAEPVEIVENLGIGRGMGDADDLLGKSGFVALDFVETFEVALDGILWVANLASSATDKIIRSITVADEAGAHHESSEMADMKRIGTRIGAPIKITRSFV